MLYSIDFENLLSKTEDLNTFREHIKSTIKKILKDNILSTLKELMLDKVRLEFVFNKVNYDNFLDASCFK